MGGAYAIEQTNMVNTFLKLCGDWMEESTAFESYLVRPTASEVDFLRKEVWDRFSVVFAAASDMHNTVICVPVGEGVSIDVNKTLMKLELPKLNTQRYCVLGYDAKNNVLVVNPHIDQGAARARVTPGQKLCLSFLPWNKQSYNAIVRYAKG
jgi:hypothetical protein